MTRSTRDYAPDQSKLPLLGDWMPVANDAVWQDGTQLLVAVPIVGVTDWYYEYSVVEIKCDEGYFELECNDDPWGWTWHDIDFYIQLSGAKPMDMETYSQKEGKFNE